MNMQLFLSSGWYLPFLAYLIGSFSFSLWISKLIAGIDIREKGSGHATTTNTIRQLGWLPGVIVFALDFSKGFFPSYFAVFKGYSTPVILLTAALTVVGHCWPVFAQFRGGMGLAAAGGAFFAINFAGGMITLTILISMVLLYGHAARGSAAASIILAPVLWLFGYRGTLFWTVLVVGWILAARFYQQDWNREYRQLWLDKKE